MNDMQQAGVTEQSLALLLEAQWPEFGSGQRWLVWMASGAGNLATSGLILLRNQGSC